MLLPRSLPRRGFSRIGVLVVVVIVLLTGGFVLSALLQVRDVAGGSANRISCINNLREIGLACHLYNDSVGHLPTEVPGIDSPEGLFYALATFLEINDPRQAKQAEMAYRVFLCPSRHSRVVGPYTDYGYYQTGDLMYDSVFYSAFGLPCTLKELESLDGTAYTILLSHVGSKPSDYNDPALVPLKKWYQGPHYVADGSGGFLQDSATLPRGAIASPHPGVVPTLFGDAHVANLPIAQWGKPGVAKAAWGYNDGNENLPPWP